MSYCFNVHLLFYKVLAKTTAYFTPTQQLKRHIFVAHPMLVEPRSCTSRWVHFKRYNTYFCLNNAPDYLWLHNMNVSILFCVIYLFEEKRWKSPLFPTPLGQLSEPLQSNSGPSKIYVNSEFLCNYFRWIKWIVFLTIVYSFVSKLQWNLKVKAKHHVLKIILTQVLLVFFNIVTESWILYLHCGCKQILTFSSGI